MDYLFTWNINFDVKVKFYIQNWQEKFRKKNYNVNNVYCIDIEGIFMY